MVKINLEDLKNNGSIFIEKELENLSSIDEEFLKYLKVSFQVDFIPDDLLISKGTLFVELNKICDICLNTYIHKINIPFYREYFLSDLGEIATLNLTEDIREEFWLGLPIIYRCKYLCKGLCSICGVNLNNQKCDCEKDNIENNPENPFNILRNFKK
ncbi:MAG: DUF177 domain-containing protein [bacterium]|nr:DUF177 domain-containing protein [bacterium]